MISRAAWVGFGIGALWVSSTGLLSAAPIPSNKVAAPAPFRFAAGQALVDQNVTVQAAGAIGHRSLKADRTKQHTAITIIKGARLLVQVDVWTWASGEVRLDEKL